jgi:hypothetical protein
MIATDVIVPTWNGRDLLEDCLRALDGQTRPADRVIVVDNGSTDGTPAWLAEAWPAVEIVQLAGNHGFAGAAQAGIEHSTAELVALLNNDARPRPAWLAAAEGAFADSEVGACASVILLPEGTVESAGLRICVWGVGRRYLEGAPASDLPGAPVEVFGASCGAAVFRRRALMEAGGFDRSFFAQDEDIDLAYRLRYAGFSCVLNPGAVVTHLGGQTLRRDPDLSLRLAERNLEWVFWLNTPRWAWPALGLLHSAYQSASLVRHVVAGRGHLVLEAKRSAVRSLCAKRRERGCPRGFARRIAPWLLVAQRPWRTS